MEMLNLEANHPRTHVISAAARYFFLPKLPLTTFVSIRHRSIGDLIQNGVVDELDLIVEFILILASVTTGLSKRDFHLDLSGFLTVNLQSGFLTFSMKVST